MDRFVQELESRRFLSAALKLAAKNLAANNKSGLVIAINTMPMFAQTTLHFPAGVKEFTAPFENRVLKPSTKGELTERFSPYGVHVYTWGPEPSGALAREQHE